MKIDFSKFSSVKIGNIIDVTLIDNIIDFDGVVIGGANNVLISPNPPKLGILDKNFDYIHIKNGILTIGAKTNAIKIFKFAKIYNIGGFEFLAALPGTIGGLIHMNAGINEHEISVNLDSVVTNFGTILKKDCAFSYRHSQIKGVVYEANFHINRHFDNELCNELILKRKNQPRGASFGSCFSNPKGHYAGRLLEEVGLKGKKIGNCGFSQIHANFLINYGGGNFDEAMELITLAKQKVFDKFGISLTCEVVIL